MGAPFAAVPRLLVATEGHVEAAGSAIEVDVAGTNTPGDAPRVFDVLALHIARQAVGRVIGHGDGFFLRIIGNHRQHRSEDFLAGDGHVVRDPGEHRGTHEVTGADSLGQARAPRNQPGSLIDTRLNQALNLVELGFRDHGAHPGIGAGRVPHHHGCGDSSGDFFRLGQARTGDEHARRRVTGLPRVVHHVQHPASDGLLEIRIIENDVG